MSIHLIEILFANSLESVSESQDSARVHSGGNLYRNLVTRLLYFELTAALTELLRRRPSFILARSSNFSAQKLNFKRLNIMRSPSWKNRMFDLLLNFIKLKIISPVPTKTSNKVYFNYLFLEHLSK